MERTKKFDLRDAINASPLKTFLTISEEQALELYSTDAFLVINKKVLKCFGLKKAMFLCNLVDKYRYFIKHNLLDKQGGFYLTHEQQTEQTGMSENELRECKRGLLRLGVIRVERKGIPAKEFYYINLQKLMEETNRSSPQESRGLDLGKVEDKTSCFQRSIYNNNKYNNNKYNNNSLSETKNASDSDRDNTSKSSNNNLDQYLPVAERLAEIIQSSKNIRHTPGQIKGWAKQIKLLVEQNKVPLIRVRRALRWYSKHIGQPYVPVIESGVSLREKFIKLEGAMERDNGNQQKERFTVKGYKSISLSPEQILQSCPDSSNRLFKEAYDPARQLLSSHDFDIGSDQQLAQNIKELYSWFMEKQKPPDLNRLNLHSEYEHAIYCKWTQIIPNAEDFVIQYVVWLGIQHWLESITPDSFLPKSKLVTRFIQSLQKKIGFDVFMGASLEN